MARVVHDEVVELVDTGRDTRPFIAMATLIVDEELTGLGYTADRLKHIELMLAAHFLLITEEKGGVQRSEVGDSTETYQRRDLKGMLGFASTRWGEQAIALDSKGKLANMVIAQQHLKALFTVV